MWKSVKITRQDQIVVFHPTTAATARELRSPETTPSGLGERGPRRDGLVTVWANVSRPAPESRVFSANCGQSLFFSIDRWRDLCGAVIQVEAKLELSRVRHEAGMPWRIEHDFNMNFLDTGQP